MQIRDPHNTLTVDAQWKGRALELTPQGEARIWVEAQITESHGQGPLAQPVAYTVRCSPSGLSIEREEGPALLLALAVVNGKLCLLQKDGEDGTVLAQWPLKARSAAPPTVTTAQR